MWSSCSRRRRPWSVPVADLRRIGDKLRAGQALDFDDGMGGSTCVACGECVQACPTGALMEANLLDDKGVRTEFEDRSVDTLCPYC